MLKISIFMEPKHAFILSLLLTILIANNVYVFSNLEENERTKVLITEIIDGDTIKTQSGLTLRLLNINSPEKNIPGFDEAKKFLSQFKNQTVEIETLEYDKYGRTLARVFTPAYINLEIVEKGLATKFLVDESELTEFAEAEELAIRNSLGIWKKSPYSDCFESKINEEEEKILIKNNCEPVSVKNWVIKDESRKEYKLQEANLGKINVHTKAGIDNETDLFWNSAQNVWNDDRDTLYLFDSERRLVHHEAYGY